MATGTRGEGASGTVEEKRRIPLSRLDTQDDEMRTWKTAENEQVARDTLDKMSGAISTLIECLGESPEREGLRRTPVRAAKALCFFTKGYEDNLTSTTCTGCRGQRLITVYTATKLVYIVFWSLYMLLVIIHAFGIVVHVCTLWYICISIVPGLSFLFWEGCVKRGWGWGYNVNIRDIHQVWWEVECLMRTTKKWW